MEVQNKLREKKKSGNYLAEKSFDKNGPYYYCRISTITGNDTLY